VSLAIARFHPDHTHTHTHTCNAHTLPLLLLSSRDGALVGLLELRASFRLPISAVARDYHPAAQVSFCLANVADREAGRRSRVSASRVPERQCDADCTPARCDDLGGESFHFTLLSCSSRDCSTGTARPPYTRCCFCSSAGRRKQHADTRGTFLHACTSPASHGSTRA
jgi:hypothetical protein